MTGPDPLTTVTSISPARDDDETTARMGTPARTTCPVCTAVFTPVGRQRYCRSACRKTAHRRRRAIPDQITVPATAGRRERTVYQCPECEGLQLGVQRCAECQLFGRSLGLGGHCPHCDEPVTLEDLDLTTA